MDKYVKPSFIQKHFDISSQTIRKWADTGKVKSIKMPDSNRRLIDYNDFLKHIGGEQTTKANQQKRNFCYARVSSSHQKDDLKRQVDYLKSKYPTYEIIEDIGSGLNWKRKGLETLLELVLSNSVGQVVVTNSDRLSRFAFEHLQWLFKKFGSTILVLNQTTNSNPQVELSDDILSIITYFTAKNNGLRAANNRKNRNIEIKKNTIVSDNPGETNA